MTQRIWQDPQRECDRADTARHNMYRSLCAAVERYNAASCNESIVEPDGDDVTCDWSRKDECWLMEVRLHFKDLSWNTDAEELAGCLRLLADELDPRRKPCKPTASST